VISEFRNRPDRDQAAMCGKRFCVGCHRRVVEDSSGFCYDGA
jgi:hypothetical protein